jgi:hypothetical protein
MFLNSLRHFWWQQDTEKRGWKLSFSNTRRGKKDIWFEVLTAMVMKSSFSWNIMPCSPFKVNRYFGGTSRVRLQTWRISQARSQYKIGSKKGTVACVVLVSCLVYSLTLKMQATRSSDNGVEFQRTTLHHTPEDRNLRVWRYHSDHLIWKNLLNIILVITRLGKEVRILRVPSG